MCLDWALEQVTFSAPTGAGAVHVAIVATQALQILIARTAVVRVRMGMVMAVAGRRVVQAVRVAAAVAHLARISALVSNCQLQSLYLNFLFLFLFRFLFLSTSPCAPFPISDFQSSCRPSSLLPLAELISGHRFVFQLGLG